MDYPDVNASSRAADLPPRGIRPCLGWLDRRLMKWALAVSASRGTLNSRDASLLIEEFGVIDAGFPRTSRSGDAGERQ